MMTASQATCRFKFQALPEFFFDYLDAAQHDPAFRATTLPKFGLIDRHYDSSDGHDSKTLRNETLKPWQRFQAYIEYLNEQGSDSTTYKILYITRHGLGYHNVYETNVGREAWNSHWSHLDGDGKTVWADSQLNADGMEQAKGLGRFWLDLVAEDRVPLPKTIYTSPLRRCLETTRLVFSDVMSKQGCQFHPIVKEFLRERLIDHTCDRRSSLTWIKEYYPDYIIEPGFSEEDTLWSSSSSRSETVEEHVARKQYLLEDIFETDQSAFIALTTHSYAISAILRAVGLKEFRVSEGSSIALLVKAERLKAFSRD